MVKNRKVRNKRKAGSLTKETAATKLQSFNRGKTTRKHTKRFELYKKLPDDLQSIVNKKYKSIPVLRRENNKLLFEGARQGNLKKVKYALDNYAEVNATDDHGETALHFASGWGRTEIVRLLLEKGVDVNASDDDNITALHLASEYGHTEVVRLLLDAGADKDMKDFEDKTAFHWASSNGHIEIVKMLLNRDTQVNAKDQYGDTALYMASFYGRTEVVKFLLRYGADLNVKNKNGRTALDKVYQSLETFYDIVDDYEDEELEQIEDRIYNLEIVLKLLEKAKKKINKIKNS